MFRGIWRLVAVGASSHKCRNRNADELRQREAKQAAVSQKKNKMNQAFQFPNRIRSFRHAFVGIWTMLKSQHNAWVHAVATVIVIVLGTISGVSGSEWCWLVLAIMAVWTAEALNTAFEFLADVASPQFHPLVKKAKDVAAGAVLISAIGAVIIGLIILGPHLLETKN